MRTKLYGAFIAALAITAFAALPTGASAANVTLKEGPTTIPVDSTLRATSPNTTFKGRPSTREVACDKTSLRRRVNSNPGARLTFRPGGIFEAGNGTDRCVVTGTGGRVKARVENVSFRKDITLQKTGTAVSGRTEARFTFRFFDRELEPNGPIAVCNYDGEIEVTNTVGSDTFHAESAKDAQGNLKDAKLEGTSAGECDEEGRLAGDFRLTRRDGTTPVTTN